MSEVIGFGLTIGFVFLVYKANQSVAEAKAKGIKEGAERCARIANSYIQDRVARERFENEVRKTLGF
jgi:hypothetical protein